MDELKQARQARLQKHFAEKRKINARLEYLRTELRAERISYDETHELQSLAEHIDPNDVELLQAAGVPEFPEDTEVNATINLDEPAHYVCPDGSILFTIRNEESDKSVVVLNFDHEDVEVTIGKEMVRNPTKLTIRLKS